MSFSKIKNFLFSTLIMTVLLVAPFFYALAGDPTYGLNAAANKAYGRKPDTLQNDPVTIVGVIVGIVLSALGIIFLIQIVIAGISWMVAQGNDEKITKAKQNLVHSIIGLLIVLGAYTIVNYVFGGIMQAIVK